MWLRGTVAQFPPFVIDRDNSVYLRECSPFWVGIFITFNKENNHVYCFM